MTFSQLLSFSISLLAIINPIAIVSVFLALTSQAEPAEVKKIPLKFFIAMVIIMLISIWLGHSFLSLFGLTLPDLQFAGGIVLLLIGLNMIMPKTTTDTIHKSVKSSKSNLSSIAIVPLAIPLGAGPGVITLLIEAAERQNTITDKLSISAVAFIMSIICALVVYFAPVIGRKIGETGMKTLGRIIGLIIAAIGASMLLRALMTLFPGLLH